MVDPSSMPAVQPGRLIVSVRGAWILTQQMRTLMPRDPLCLAQVEIWQKSKRQQTGSLSLSFVYRRHLSIQICILKLFGDSSISSKLAVEWRKSLKN